MKGIRIVAGLILLVVPSLIPAGDGRSLVPAEKWVARYNGPANSTDAAKDIAVDASGNVYVTGESVGSGTGSDYVTIKYNTYGKQLWLKRYNGPGNYVDEARAIAVDRSGNVYVTGRSHNSDAVFGSCDYATVKYNTNGKQLWLKRYHGPASGFGGAYALAVDGSGNVYVTGESVGSGTGSDYATIKYSTNGKQLWVARYNGPGNGDDYAHAIVVDVSGNAYVTGQSDGLGDYPEYNYATVKYAPNGRQLWVARYGEWGSARAMTMDNSGNVYVTGSTDSCDYETVKYNTNGKRLWAAKFNELLHYLGEANAIAVDTTGNVYVTGVSSDGGDYATIKYSKNGKHGPADYIDTAKDIAVDRSGNVYVTGTIQVADVEGGDIDYATIKYSPAGKQLWVKRYNGPDKDYGSDDASAIALDSSGNVYVTGMSSGSGTNYDYATVKY
jgi:uncharacterized delta-60 repeat protein